MPQQTSISSPQDAPQASIIIPSYNGKHLLETCLPSVMALREVAFEVIVVDNGSTDGSGEYVREHFPNVRLLEYEDRLGFSKASNRGIQAANGRYIALLNNDTEVEPEWLLELCRGIESDPAIGTCASKMLRASDRNLIYSAGDGLTVAGFGWRRGGEQPEKISYLSPEYVFGACGGAALYKKEVFDEVGLLDEDFYAFYEDLDLNFRAQMAGFRCLYVPSARVAHIGGATFGDKCQRPLYYGFRNRLFFLAKNWTLHLLIRNSVWIVLYSVISIILYTLKGHAGSVLAAHWDGLRDLKTYIAKREDVQARWKESPEFIEELLDRKWASIWLRWSRFYRFLYRPAEVVAAQKRAATQEVLSEPELRSAK